MFLIHFLLHPRLNVLQSLTPALRLMAYSPTVAQMTMPSVISNMLALHSKHSTMTTTQHQLHLPLPPLHHLATPPLYLKVLRRWISLCGTRVQPPYSNYLIYQPFCLFCDPIIGVWSSDEGQEGHGVSIWFCELAGIGIHASIELEFEY